MAKSMMTADPFAVTVIWLSLCVYLSRLFSTNYCHSYENM